jgi:predicted membrane protein
MDPLRIPEIDPLRIHTSRLQAVVFALLIITAGALLLLFNAGYLPETCKPIIFSWQTLLIAMGIFFLLSPPKRIPGLFLLLLGGLLLLPKLNIDGFACLRGNGWAIGLIIGGGLLLFRAFSPRLHGCRTDYRRRDYRHRRAADTHTSGEEQNYMYSNYIFAGGKEKITNQNFKGGDISCIFGGAELDFMDAQLADGDSILTVSCIFGGVTLYLPPHWKVELRQDAILGRMEDRRPRPTFDISERRTLTIKASMIFGGGEIKTR